MCINVHDYAWKCINMHQYAWLCINVHQYLLMWTSVNQCVSICMNVHQCPWVCMKMHQCKSMCLNVHQYRSICINGNQYASMGINTHQFASICINAHQYASMCIDVHQSASIYINLHQCASIYINVNQCWWMCINIPIYAWMCMNVHQCASIYRNMHQCPWMCINVRDCAWMRINVYLYALMWTSVHQCASICMNVHQCAWIWMKMLQCAWIYINVYQCALMCINVHQCAPMCMNVHCIFKPELTKLYETLIFQVKVGGKKYFFTCVYRNPSSDNNLKDNVDDFANELNSPLENIKEKNPYINFVIGDNAKNTGWWGDFTDYPGGIISNNTDLHGLDEIIHQPTHFYPGKNPSCIDLIFCTQINLISESGVLPSLLTQCHHDILSAKIDLHVSLPPPFKRTMWDYKNADAASIRRSLLSIKWERCIQNRNSNSQVEFLTSSIINIFSAFCPNRVVTCRYKDATWMTSEIKQKLKEKKKIYNKYVKNKYDLGYKQLLHEKMIETSNLIAHAKENYYQKEKITKYFLEPKKVLVDPE